MSGATDIGLWVTKQNRDLPNMIWTGRVKEFNKIDEQDDFIIIRPAVTHQEAMAKLGNKWPTIKALWKRFGSVQVRNSGTVCGNLANGSPIGDLPPALIALESLIELTNKNKKRKLPLEEFLLNMEDRTVMPVNMSLGYLCQINQGIIFGAINYPSDLIRTFPPL